MSDLATIDYIDNVLLKVLNIIVMNVGPIAIAAVYLSYD